MVIQFIKMAPFPRLMNRLALAYWGSITVKPGGCGVLNKRPDDNNPD